MPFFTNGMKISFVIPAYNEEGYIADCLRAVQTEIARFGRERPDVMVEVVVVNNVSIDRTKEIAMGFRNVRVVDEFHKGLVRARHAGFVATDGELVANIDADTRVPEGWLTRVLSEFEKNQNLVALSGPYFYYDLSPLERSLVRVFYFNGYIVYQINKLFGKGGLIQGGNFILRRDAWEKIGGFDTSIEFYGEDTDVARRLSKVGRVKWTWKLPMHTTARRLKHEGLVKTGLTYALNFFSTMYTGRPVTQKYTDIRPK